MTTARALMNRAMSVLESLPSISAPDCRAPTPPLNPDPEQCAAILRLIATALREGGPEHVWDYLAKEHQRPPQDDGWTTWLLLGGRGAGKTRAGAEWVRSLADERGGRARRIALVAEAYGDAREVMIEGPSGLRQIGHPARRPSFEASRRRLVWPNGSVGYCFSSEDPEGLRGHQFDAAWADELCKWRHAEETWSNLQLALRLGDRPRQVVTTTPRPTALLKRLMAQAGTRTVRASTYDNRDNLSAAFFSEIAALYEGTALGRQELYGEIVEDREGALWTRALIEAARMSAPPGGPEAFAARLDRVVVAVDPPATAGPTADECGVIVAGSMLAVGARRAFVLADRSQGGLSPLDWAARAVEAYHAFGASRLVVEVNQGGDMVRALIAQVDADVAVREVRAGRSKRLRAEPVAALYERGLVRHVGGFSRLEDQMTEFTGADGKSPDRLDALVWALSDLLLRPAGPSPAVRRL